MASQFSKPGGYYCRICKGCHSSPATLRECFQDSYKARGVAVPVERQKLIGGNMVMPDLSSWSSSPLYGVLPTGKYLVPVLMPSGIPKAVQLRIGSFCSGKWKGHYVISQFDDETSKFVPVSSATDRFTIVEKLKSRNWQRALMDYGRTFSECPICETPLKAEELRIGVCQGPCYTKVFS